MIRVIIADDHSLIRYGIRLAFADDPSLSLVGEAATGDETLQLCQKLQPDVLLLDIRMGDDTSPIDTVKTLKTLCPKTKIIILTAFDNEIYIRNLHQLGVKGYILKDEATDVLSEAIHTVMNGQTWFSAVVSQKISQTIPPDDMLSEREMEVLELVGEGKTNEQIGETLCLSERTIRYHIENIMHKLHVNNRVEAFALAMERGWMKKSW
jgi:DNA-binding NarL/FixJ family response regulator